MISKIKSSAISILPIVVFVLVMQLFLRGLTTETIFDFLIGVALLIVGEAVLLIGIEKSIEPMGEFIGNSVTGGKDFYIYVLFGLVFGMLSTMAEPDMQVFATTVSVAGFNINKYVFLAVAGFGVGSFISLALVRLITKWNMKFLIFLSYMLVVVLGVIVSERAFSMSLDTGTDTTGVITSPFLLALGIGVAKVVSGGTAKDEDSFGFIALASVGPIIAVEILSLLTMGQSGGAVGTGEESISLFLSVLIDVLLSIIPLVLVFFLFEKFFIKISKQEKKKLLLGTVITMLGFYVFLFGVKFGLQPMGSAFGDMLGNTNNLILIILVCSLIGFFIVMSEPGVSVLSRQIESVTNRKIPAKLVLVSLGVSVVVSIVLCVLKIYYSISIWWFVGIVYFVAFLLMIFVPQLFVAIAFDSSGVATGMLTTAFIFPMMSAVGTSNETSFGIIAMVAMGPLLVMEILGLVYKVSVDIETTKTKQMLIKLSRTEDEYSNVKKLKLEHERKFLEYNEE